MTDTGSTASAPGPEQPQQYPQPMPPAGGAQPPQWAWAQGARVTEIVETPQLEYHRLLRGAARYRWWRPLVLLLVAGAYFGVLTIVVTLVMMPLIMVFDPSYLTDLAMGATEILDTQRPMSLLLALSSIIIMIPSVLLAMLTLGMRPTGRVWSVAGRIRWGLLMRLFGVAVLAVIVMNAVGIALGMVLDPTAASSEVVTGGKEFEPTAALISMVMILILVPFQAVAEELVFRGLFMQVIGSWLKNPWWAILIPSVAFAAGHIYDIWGLAAVGLLGGVAAWLTWRTGGLEAAMAIHIANNLIVFSLLTSGLVGETAQTSEGGGLAGLIGEAAGLALFIWLALKIFRRGGYGRTRIDLIEVQVPVSAQLAPVAPSVDPAAALVEPVVQTPETFETDVNGGSLSASTPESPDTEPPRSQEQTR